MKATIIISKKIAQKLSRLPRRKRERLRKGFGRLKRNLADRETDSCIKLKIEGRQTTNEEEIRSTVEEYWKKVLRRKM